MRRAALRIVYGAFFILSSTQASAAEHDDDEEEVLVRGDGGKQTAGFVSRRSIEDSPREITDAASLIEPMPGVHVRRLGADDSFSTLSIRGSSSTQVAVYLAGVPLSGGADPTLDLATLPLWPGAQARVFRTFAPAGLGRGSLGGTLVLDPPSPKSLNGSKGGADRTEVWDAIGSYGAARVRIGDIHKLGDGEIRVATGLSASRSDDDFTYLDPLSTIAARGRDVYTTRLNAGHAAASGLASILIPLPLGPGKGGALSITTLAQARRQELPGSITLPTASQRLDSTRIVQALELTVPAGANSNNTTIISARLWGRREGLELSDSPLSAQKTFSPIATDDAIVAAGTSVGVRGRPKEGASVELRIDGSGERYMPGTWNGAVAPPGATRANTGVAFDGNVRALRDNVTLAASARGDMWIDANDGSGTANKTELRPTGNVGAEIPIGPVIAATHAGFVARPPSFVERYGNRGTFIGDPAIRTESAFTVDGGGRIISQRIGPVRLHVESSGFATWADDLIAFVFVGAQGRSKAMNIGTARVYGIESEIRASAFGFEARATHTGLLTMNGSGCRFVGTRCERPPLPGRPEHDVVADLAYEHAKTGIRARYGVDVVTGISADLTGETPVPTRVLHGASIRSPVPGVKNLSLTLDVRNLFNLRVGEYAAVGGLTDRYPVGDLYNFPLPGRRVMLSARWVSD